MIENKDIDYVLAIYRNHSISGAAEELFITQPALTKYLQNLESRLGVVLFERTRRHVKLTEAGARYIKYASQIASLEKALEREMALVKYEEQNSLRVGYSNTDVRNYVIQAADSLMEKNPSLSIQLEEKTSINVENSMLDGSINIGFLALPETIHPSLSATVLFEESILLAVPEEHPLAASGMPIRGSKYPWVDLGKFANDRFILRSADARFREIVNKLFDQYQFSPKIFTTTRSQHSSIEYAERYRVCTMTTESFMNLKTPGSMKFFLVGSPMETIQVGYVTRKDSPVSQPMRDLLTEVYRLIT